MMFRRMLYLLRGEAMPVVAKKKKIYNPHVGNLVEFVPASIYNSTMPATFYDELYSSKVIRSRNNGNKT